MTQSYCLTRVGNSNNLFLSPVVRWFWSIRLIVISNIKRLDNFCKKCKMIQFFHLFKKNSFYQFYFLKRHFELNFFVGYRYGWKMLRLILKRVIHSKLLWTVIKYSSETCFFHSFWLLGTISEWTNDFRCL